jgi:hypothetical protein
MNSKHATAVPALLAAVLLSLAIGCSDPYTMYQTSGGQVATGETILVMPFMDTRTFLAKNDPHAGDVGIYVRDIFADVLREHAADSGAEVVAPDMAQPTQSMSTSEIAALGRRHGADAVVAGQVFSFNNTRAASIPPRAGMFVRVVSVKTGAVLFAGDHYNAASVPLGAGNRDDQARLVATKLVEGFLAQSTDALTASLAVSSSKGLANISPEETGEPAPEPVVIVQNPIVPMQPTEVDELPELGMETVNGTLASIDARAAISERLADLSGDELAGDLLAAEGNIFGDEADDSVEPVFAAVTEAPGAPGSDAESLSGQPSAVDGESVVALAPEAPAAPMSEVESATEILETEVLAVATHTSALDNGPVVSEPMTFEQPRTYRVYELPEDPAAARQDAEALIASPAARGDAGALRVLILPYHDRENENNLIPNTGGGEVVTTLYGTQLALDPGITLMWDGTGMATHNRLLSRDEAVEMGRLAGADYVMRGQVVEFRRAQSVPSFYSAMISTAMLAAQMFFAEMSGVDVATEVYRVSDGLCVMSRRDRSQQKYVVQAEKTVRRLAAGMADSVSRAIRAEEPEEMDPLIDSVQPVGLFTNPQ